MEKAAFKLDGYRFTRVNLDMTNPLSSELDVSFKPVGRFNQKESKFFLNFDTVVSDKNAVVISISCTAVFSFQGKITINDIPDFFYPNSIAIIFPYVRAFIGTVSLQANIRPVMLPTLNLTGLMNDLRRNTTVSE